MLTQQRRPSTRVSTMRSPTTTGEHARSTKYVTPMRPGGPLAAGTARATVSVVSGLDAGRIVPLEGASLVMGRGDESDLQLDDVEVSRLHARIVRGSGGSFHLEDLGSTNGTFVNTRRVTVAPLTDGDRIQLGPRTLVRFALTDPLDERVQADLYESSIRDPLTRAYNRRYLSSRLVAEVAHARRHGVPLAALMLDVDNFKQFNDRYGHFVGDRILCFVVAHASRVLRAGDLLARFGGDEFVVLARETDLAHAAALGDRMRGAIEGLHMSAGGKVVSITTSIGVGALEELAPEADAEALVELIDGRLGAAKREGRNRVCAATG
jgi:diguanylate cyclase (GGDEF)-like protein